MSTFHSTEWGGEECETADGVEPVTLKLAPGANVHTFIHLLAQSKNVYGGDYENAWIDY